MPPIPFVHLHCHSHYSLLDGAGKLDALIGRAKELEMNAIALTDHGNMYGALEFYQKAKDAGIKAIIGYEAYIAPGSRHEKSGATSVKDASFHLTLLAKDIDGYHNLLQLASLAFTEGYYYRPRIDKESLRQHNKGLICLSGCAGSEFARAVVNGTADNFARAKQVAEWYRDLFGDRYFLEIQDAGLEIQRLVLNGTLKVAQEIGIPLVATNDVHYVKREDAEIQDILLCLSTGKYRTDVNRMKMETDQLFLRSGEQMLQALPDQREAIERSQTIADSCELSLELGKRFFPTFVPPGGNSSDDYLRELCLIGLKHRYAGNEKRMPNGELSEEVMARLNRELSVIQKLGFPNYFLIVWDFVRIAEERGIHRTARGSGVGALVCYALNLSHVCPLEFDLLFERFLDENRLEAPDIDIDFDQQRRGEILDYVKEKYGHDNVAQIGTFGTMAAKMAIKDVGRALGMPLSFVNEVTKLVPEAPKMTLKKAFEQNDELQKLYDSNTEAHELLDFAKGCEGLARSSGTHACAVVISDRPLTDFLPIQSVQNKDEIVTQWAMAEVEKAGLLKMDFLGLRNLSILSQAIDIIEQTTGERIDPYRYPLNDSETYALLCRGETKGVFQLEGGGIRELLQRMKPDSFRDVIATLALYRPGPLEGGMVDQYIDVKHGRKQAEYPHPIMKEVLEETHGVMVYQEQIMRIMNRLGGVPLAAAYTCIKAISKKKEAVIAKAKGDFIEGVQKNGLSKEEGEHLFELIQKFAGYGFNKSHSTAYALIAYMTAYLKAHYPVEFMASLLCGDISNRNFTKKDSTVEHLEDCQRMGIEVVPPDVNASHQLYFVKDGKIHFSLIAIKGCNEYAANAIVAARKNGGPFRSLFDFCERVPNTVCIRSTVEILIKAGAFDSLGYKRAQLMQILDKAYFSAITVSNDRAIGQRSLFEEMNAEENANMQPETAAAITGLPEVDEWPDKEKSMYEKEVLGFYLSTHPLKQYSEQFKSLRSHSTEEALTLPDRTEVILAGMVNSIKLATTKNPKPDKPNQYAMFDFEDMDGMIRGIIWPEQYALYSHLVKSDSVVIAAGKIDKSRSQTDSDANVVVERLLTLEEAQTMLTRGVTIVISESHGEETLRKLYEIVRGYPGASDFELNIRFNDGRLALMKCKSGITLNAELRRRVTELLGESSYKLIAAPKRAFHNNNGNKSYRTNGSNWQKRG
ncbi:MAG: DNA polymerase III subunit alpha [Planctomycetaceae bacterium]|jgi:DNA polymerase-3 subunit alpha|nr:DNA polymerase III subunit alpha [Planctomycetaceae bacterium]